MQFTFTCTMFFFKGYEIIKKVAKIHSVERIVIFTKKLHLRNIKRIVLNKDMTV